MHVCCWPPKSVRNCCLIELFCVIVCVVTLAFWHFCWCRCFCHRTGSDLLLFVLVQRWFMVGRLADGFVTFGQRRGLRETLHWANADCLRWSNLATDAGSTLDQRIHLGRWPNLGQMSKITLGRRLYNQHSHAIWDHIIFFKTENIAVYKFGEFYVNIYWYFYILMHVRRSDV